MVSSSAASSARSCASLCQARHVLVLHEARRGEHRVHVRIRAALQVVQTLLRRVHRARELRGVRPAHGLHGLEALHLVLDGWVAAVQIVEHVAQLRIRVRERAAHAVAPRRELCVHRVVERAQLGVHGARGLGRCAARRERSGVVRRRGALRDGRARRSGGLGRRGRRGGCCVRRAVGTRVCGRLGRRARRAGGRSGACLARLGDDGRLGAEERLARLEELEEVGALGLVCPALCVLGHDVSARVHLAAAADEHVARRHDVHDGRVAGVCARDPDLDRDIVHGAAVLDGERAVEEQEERRAAVVVGCVSGVRTVHVGAREERRVFD